MFNETADHSTADPEPLEAGSSLRVRAPSPESLTPCVHHWLLSEPVAGVIAGRCKRCGGERDFPATPEGIERLEDYRELAQARPTPAMRERSAS